MFDRALAFVLDAEGGYSNDPDDHGGATNFGVTQDAYDRYRRRVGSPPRPVDEITGVEVRAVYEWYWTQAQCNLLPYPVNVVVFDTAVNSGPVQARRLLQQAAGVLADGILGPKSLAAVAARQPGALAEDMLWERQQFYVRIAQSPGQLKFLRGWLNRLYGLRRYINPATPNPV